MFVKDLFPVRLKLLREQHAITMNALAIVVEKKRPAISQFELGLNLPSIDTLIAIADFFCVSIDYLVGRTNDPQQEYFLQIAEENLKNDEVIWPVYQKEKEDFSPEDLPKLIMKLKIIKAELPERLRKRILGYMENTYGLKDFIWEKVEDVFPMLPKPDIVYTRRPGHDKYWNLEGRDPNNIILTSDDLWTEWINMSERRESKKNSPTKQ